MNNSLIGSIKPQFRTIDGLRHRRFCSVATHVPSSPSPRSRSTATPTGTPSRTVERGIGRDLSQEPPEAFASAVLEVTAMR
jgi:hypothetical protein